MLNGFRGAYYNGTRKLRMSDSHTNVINTCPSQMSLHEINSRDDKFLCLSESRVPCVAYTIHTEFAICEVEETL